MLAAGALAAACSLVALCIPLIAGAFERTPQLDEIALILAANLTATLAAAALVIPFPAPILRSPALSILGLAACIVLTIPLRVPPLTPAAKALDTTDPRHAVLAIVRSAAVVFTYALAGPPSVSGRRRE